MADYSKTPVWLDSQVPDGYTGSWHVGNGVFRQRCRICPETHDSLHGSSMRYNGIGPHEVEAHGLQVAGINVGMLA